MTPAELKAIRERCQLATPNLTLNSRSEGIFIRGADRDEHIALFSGKNLVNDSAFYEMARADVPALLAEVELLYGELRDAEEREARLEKELLRAAGRLAQ